jgi:hypothetical protein
VCPFEERNGEGKCENWFYEKEKEVKGIVCKKHISSFQIYNNL